MIHMESLRLYHGSASRLVINSELSARYSETEFWDRESIDGIRIEEFVELHRPRGYPSRLKCFFMVDDTKDLNAAGASEDYVYEFEPLSSVAVAHFGSHSSLCTNS